MYLYTVYYILVSHCHELGVTTPNFTFRVKCVTCFTPNQVRSQQIHTPELIKILFWVSLHLIHYAHNVVLSAQLNHLIAWLIYMNVNLAGANLFGCQTSSCLGVTGQPLTHPVSQESIDSS